jgi:hypothetical protein
MPSLKAQEVDMNSFGAILITLLSSLFGGEPIPTEDGSVREPIAVTQSENAASLPKVQENVLPTGDFQ